MSIVITVEIGINANGSEELAKMLIKAAKDAGADYVKFQKRDIDTCYTKEFLDSPRESPWGDTQRHQKKGLEFSQQQYESIDAFCKTVGIGWYASAWDVPSQIFLRQFNLPHNKIASAMLGHKPLLREVASEKRHTFISTGMSSISEIAEAVDIFRDGGCSFTLLHCNSSYPMREEDANLRCIQTLRDRFGCEVGYSGHETSLVKVCVAAVALGATAIERHITLDRAMLGSDQAASIETHHLRDFVETVRAIPAILGTGVKDVTETEWSARKKLRVEVA